MDLTVVEDSVCGSVSLSTKNATTFIQIVRHSFLIDVDFVTS